MDWLTVLVLAIALAGAGILSIRTVPGRRWVSLLAALVVAVLVYRWAEYRGAWQELSWGAAIGLLGFLLWWGLIGRTLPTPQDSIRVWSEDDPF